MQSLFWIILFIAPVWVALNRDYQRGLCNALVLFALMPSTLRISVGSAFEFTFQRVLLILVLGYWIRWIASRGRPLKIPFIRIVAAWWVANLLSLIFSPDKGLSLKWFVSFSTEIVLFYVIVSTSLTDAASILGAFRALCVSSAIIALLGAIEYYTQFNPVLQWMGILEPGKAEGDVIATFRHRILFGYSAAMGWPLLLALAQRLHRQAASVGVVFVAMVAIAGAYFSNSRGPWFAVPIAGVILLVLATRRMRRTVLVFCLLAVVVLVARPGVRATVYDLVMTTNDPDSYRGGSYEYRKELWPVAFDLAGSSPVRALFGHGGQSTETMDLHSRFEYGGSTFNIGYSSWDNNYACDLVEFGYVGLSIEVVFYVCILAALSRSAVRCRDPWRNVAVACLAATVVYMFALTNVYMFSPQLKCMFMTLITIGARLPILASEGDEEPMAGTADEAGSRAPCCAAETA